MIMENRACVKQLTLAAVCVLLSLSLLVWGAEAAAPKKPAHKDCASCHEGKDRTAIKKKINETCLKCHAERKGKDHAVGMVSKVVPEGLPLGPGNRVTCSSCHEPHGKDTHNALLRMEFNRLCMACHKDK